MNTATPRCASDHAVPARGVGAELADEAALRRVPQALDAMPTTVAAAIHAASSRPNATQRRPLRRISERQQQRGDDARPRAPSAAASTDRAARAASSARSGRRPSGTRSGAISGTNTALKYGGPTEILPSAERIDEQRIQRAEQHRSPPRRPAARCWRAATIRARPASNLPPSADLRRAPRVQHQRAADDEREEREDEHAALRIGRERVHRSQHARAHQERAEQRQRERGDREQHRPALESCRASRSPRANGSAPCRPATA